MVYCFYLLIFKCLTRQWRAQEFCLGGGGGLKKLVWGQGTEKRGFGGR